MSAGFGWGCYWLCQPLFRLIWGILLLLLNQLSSELIFYPLFPLCGLWGSFSIQMLMFSGMIEDCTLSIKHCGVVINIGSIVDFSCLCIPPWCIWFLHRSRGFDHGFQCLYRKAGCKLRRLKFWLEGREDYTCILYLYKKNIWSSDWWLDLVSEISNSWVGLNRAQCKA